MCVPHFICSVLNKPSSGEGIRQTKKERQKNKNCCLLPLPFTLIVAANFVFLLSTTAALLCGNVLLWSFHRSQFRPSLPIYFLWLQLARLGTSYALAYAWSVPLGPSVYSCSFPGACDTWESYSVVHDEACYKGFSVCSAILFITSIIHSRRTHDTTKDSRSLGLH